MYRIGPAAERAGVTPELLRAWERRYALVSPTRTEGGYRVYSEEDVHVLRGARRKIAEGLSIGEAAKLPRESLVEAGRDAAEALSSVPLSLERALPNEADRQRVLDAAFEAIRRFDVEALDRLFGAASGFGALGSIEMCEAVMLPLLGAIGDRWEAGELSVTEEHFGSGWVRFKLLQLVEAESRRGPDRALVLCACPEGEQHEGALLAFAVAAAGSDCRVAFLGANTPVADIAAAAERRQAEYIALSVTMELDRPRLAELRQSLGAWAAGGRGRRVLIGGRAALPHRAALRGAGFEVFDRFAAPWRLAPVS